MRQTVSKRVTAKITGTGSYLPVDTVDNFDLYELGTLKSLFDVDKGRASLKDIEEVEDLSDSEVFDLWARQVTGIEMRRRLTPESGLTTEDMCAAACLSALEAAGCASTDMDLLIAASLTRLPLTLKRKGSLQTWPWIKPLIPRFQNVAIRKHGNGSIHFASSTLRTTILLSR